MNRDLVINELLKGLDARSASTISAAAAFSKSQYCQDIFALSKPPMTSGFFVEFGATDGVQWSNTWLLEKRFGWRGILAEPARA